MNTHKNNQDEWNSSRDEKIKQERSQSFLDLIQLLIGSHFDNAIDFSDDSPFFYPFKRIFLYGKKN